ncbi:hypothetical protein [Bradyrhizobium neotropicale]|uniref:hypothetical protein n=1 Tax=Bradyrhizobium neotropicale TaxID=1497615 RepID=UPI000A4FD35E|nr:hypothetical protein [Bradyrhizobium neotropicale]
MLTLAIGFKLTAVSRGPLRRGLAADIEKRFVIHFVRASRERLQWTKVFISDLPVGRDNIVRQQHIIANILS